MQRRANTSEQDIKELYREIGELKAKVENSSRPVVETKSRKAPAPVTPVSTADAELKKIKASISSLESAQESCVRESDFARLKSRVVAIESVIREIEKSVKESVTPGCIAIDHEWRSDPNVLYDHRRRVDIPCKCLGFVPEVEYDGKTTKSCKNCGHDKSQHTRFNVKID